MEPLSDAQVRAWERADAERLRDHFFVFFMACVSVLLDDMYAACFSSSSPLSSPAR